MGFDKWRDDEGQRVARELRERDLTIQIITDSVHRGVTTEAEALEQLGDVYAGYSYLEHKFHILRCGAQREALEVYRDG
jgi:hypothetical protein